jgi:F-type H+-transporting ATPase subunit gamma
MASLRDIKRRITSVKNTQQITNAMKMVSAAKLQRAQDRVLATRPYAQRMDYMVEHLQTRVRSSAHDLLAPRTEGKTLLVLLTSDRGLCGGFNSNVQRTALEHIRELTEAGEVEVIAIGKKGRDFLHYRRIEVLETYVEIFIRQVDYHQAKAITEKLLKAYEEEHYRQVLVVYNRFQSAISQQVTVLRLLPISGLDDPEADPEEPFDYVYEPSAPQVLDSLLRRQIEIQLFQIFQESFAGEHGARMTAMDSATSNASEMIGSLTLTYNRARQAAITTELIEVVSGADALRG